MRHLRVRRILLCAVFVLSCITSSLASVFGDIRGIVFDPQHRAIAGVFCSTTAKRLAALISSNRGRFISSSDIAFITRAWQSESQYRER